MGDGARRAGEAASAGELLALARRRLADELERLPGWKTPAFWRQVRTEEPGRVVSLGALAHCVRRAAQAEDVPAARELFTLLIGRIERQNLRWAAQTVARTPVLRGDSAEAARDDLTQEIALYLWQRLRAGGEQWDLFFARALVFAQRHVAAAYMEKRGLWPRAGVRQPSRIAARLVERLAAAAGEDGTEATDGAEPADEAEPLAAAELADLRALVLELPLPERVAVVLRFWQGASEDEIARALGGVTARTVRNYLRRAYTRLRAAYEGVEVTT